jgi:DNA polymerase I-like protein with 3'-5' exonuclease and polymerase domains
MEMGQDVFDTMMPLQVSIMEGVAPFMSVPLEVDVKRGERWGSLKKIGGG